MPPRSTPRSPTGGGGSRARTLPSSASHASGDGAIHRRVLLTARNCARHSAIGRQTFRCAATAPRECRPPTPDRRRAVRRLGVPAVDERRRTARAWSRTGCEPGDRRPERGYRRRSPAPPADESRRFEGARRPDRSPARGRTSYAVIGRSRSDVLSRPGLPLDMSVSGVGTSARFPAHIKGSEADNPAVWRPGCHPPADEEPTPLGEAQHAATPGPAAGRLHPRDPRRARAAHRAPPRRRSATGCSSSATTTSATR